MHLINMSIQQHLCTPAEAGRKDAAFPDRHRAILAACPPLLSAALRSTPLLLNNITDRLDSSQQLSTLQLHVREAGMLWQRGRRIRARRPSGGRRRKPACWVSRGRRTRRSIATECGR